jgi:hypothetical protein
MDNRLDIATKMLAMYQSLSQLPISQTSRMDQISQAFNVGTSASRAYLKVAALPDSIKSWINGEEGMVEISFYTAVSAFSIFKSRAVDVLNEAYSINKEAIDHPVKCPYRATISYLQDLADYMGVSPSGSRKEPPCDTTQLGDYDMYTSEYYSYEWCITQINRIVCSEIPMSILHGVVDRVDNTFSVKMPASSGIELRRLIMLMQDLRDLRH